MDTDDKTWRFAAPQNYKPNAAKNQAGLRLVPWTAIFGGDSADWVVRAGNVEASPLHSAITMPRAEEGAMPPEDKAEPLTSAEVETITQWIQAGATGPDGQAPPESQVPSVPEAPPATSPPTRGDQDA